MTKVNPDKVSFRNIFAKMKEKLTHILWVSILPDQILTEHWLALYEVCGMFT